MSIEEPKVESQDDYLMGKVVTHPAFGQIALSRVRGSSKSLYGSDFAHNNFIELTICASEDSRSLSSNKHFQREQKISIFLSEAQWSELVSSVNLGAGVPCTISRFDGKPVPEIPLPKPKTDQFNSEMMDTFREAMAGIAELKTTLREVKLSKTKQNELQGQIDQIGKAITSSMPFVKGQFDKYMDSSMSKAKSEIHGYLSQYASKIDHVLGNDEAPIAITDDKEN